LWANGLVDDALSALDACLRETPRYNSCRVERIVNRIEKGRMEEAREDFETWQGYVGPKVSIRKVVNSIYSAEAKPLTDRRTAALDKLDAYIAANPKKLGEPRARAYAVILAQAESSRLNKRFSTWIFNYLFEAA
jgi:hypothetical protein